MSNKRLALPPESVTPQEAQGIVSPSRLKSLAAYLGGAPLLHLACFIGVTSVLYLTTANHLFRSDQWLIYNAFNNLGWSLEDLKRVVTFEMFGDIRFQTLAHLLLYTQYKLFGSHLLPYHLMQMALHVTNVFLIYLILRQITKSKLFAFLFGLLFATFFSYFDIVNWTYHVYVIAATALSLTAILLVVKYLKSWRAGTLVAGLSAALAAAFFYEPFLAVLPGLGLILGIHYFVQDKAHRQVYKAGILAYAAVVVLGAVVYVGSFLYIYQTTRSSQVMTLNQLFSWTNLWNASTLVFNNILNSTLTKNSGFPLDASVRDIVYLDQTVILKGGPGLLALIPSFVLILLWRPSRQTLKYVVPLGIMGLSYLFIISMGRAPTTSFEYLPAQPRYQYFADAMLALAVGIVFWTPGQRRAAQVTLACCVLAIAGLNAINVYRANQEIDRAMQPIAQYYQEASEFFKEQPSATLFVDFSTVNGQQLSLGSDIAFDVLFNSTGRITKTAKKATHIYHTYGITKNEGYDPRSIGPELGDFTAEWTYLQVQAQLRQGVTVLGSDTNRPKVWVNAAGYLQVDMVNISTGAVETFTSSERLPYGNKWTRIAVDKQGDELSLIVNGIVKDKFHLSKYQRWMGDNSDLLGHFYRGTAEIAYVVGLNVMVDESRYHSQTLEVGQDLIWQTTPGW